MLDPEDSSCGLKEGYPVKSLQIFKCDKMQQKTEISCTEIQAREFSLQDKIFDHADCMTVQKGIVTGLLMMFMSPDSYQCFYFKHDLCEVKDKVPSGLLLYKLRTIMLYHSSAIVDTKDDRQNKHTCPTIRW